MLLPLSISSAVALATCLVVTPMLRSVAHRWNITDRPDSLLKPHARPTAYLGGLGVYLGWLAGLAVMQIGWPGLVGPGVWRMLWLIAATSGLVMVVGLMDDIRSLTPAVRIVVEVAGAVMLYVAGVRFAAIPGLDPAGAAAWGLGLALQIALVLGACNATNLLDGLDGLSGGVSAIALAGLAALAGGVLFVRGADDPDGRLRGALMLAPLLAASTLGFLRSNYRPASIFLGDSGSLLLGFAVAGCWTLLCGPGAAGLHLALSGLIIFALPVGDTALAFQRRARSGLPLFQGDRSHFYDQLVDRKFTVAQAVNICYGLSVVLAIIGWIGGTLLSLAWAGLCYGVMLAAAAWALHRLGFIRPPTKG